MRRFAPDGTEFAPLAQGVPGTQSRLQMTSTTLRSMFVGSTSPNFTRFEGSLDIATGAYTQTPNLGGAKPSTFGFNGFGFGISNNSLSGDADFYQIDNGTTQQFPAAFRINGAFDRKVYYALAADGMTVLGPPSGAIPRNITYHRTCTSSAQSCSREAGTTSPGRSASSHCSLTDRDDLIADPINAFGTVVGWASQWS